MSLKIFCGDDSGLSRSICEKVNNGESEGKIEIKRFADGEERPQFQENIRETDVFVIQSTNPPAENWHRLFLMLDAAKNASARRVTAVIPYFGYGRQDRKDRPRVPLSAALFARFVRESGAGHVLTMDLHANPIEAFFGVPTDHLYARPVFIKKLKELENRDFVVVAPDAGAGPRAKGYAQRLGKNPGIHTYKERDDEGRIEKTVLIGDITPEQTAVIVDDMADTAGTLIKVGTALSEQRGVKEILAVFPHAIFSKDAIERLADSCLTGIYYSDSIELTPAKKETIAKYDTTGKFVCVSVADLFAEAIRRTHHGESISQLFE